MSTYEVNDDLYPFITTVYIRNRWGSDWYSSSGVIVGNNDILTTSHSNYNEKRGGWSDECRVYVSWDPDSSNHGSNYYLARWRRGYTDWDKNGDGLLTRGDNKYGSLYEVERDICLISLTKDIGSSYGWMGLKFNFNGGYASKLGYPGKYDNNLMYDEGYVYKDNIDNYLWYYLNAIEVNAGDSGGPIYINSGGDLGYQVIGLHASSGYGTGTAVALNAFANGWLTEEISSNNYLYDKSFASITSKESVDEGSSISITFKTHKSEEDKQYTYTLSGIASSDIASNELSGKTTINSDGEATFTIGISEDKLTEGSETLKLSIGEKTKSITINDTSKDPGRSPTNISLSSISFNENINANTSIATLTTTDPDNNDTFTYTLISGIGDTDNSAFTISESSLKINSSPDYETKSSYKIRLKTTDSGGNIFEKSFILSVNDLEEENTEKPIIYGVNNQMLYYFPRDLVDGKDVYRSINIEEGTTTEIYRFTANKEVTWSISQMFGNNDHQYFSIDSTTGSLTINGDLDYENPKAYGDNNFYIMSIDATDTAGNINNSNWFRVIITDVVDESIPTSNSATSTELQQLYIGYFGRPCDPTGLDYWLDQGVTKKAFAANMYLQPEFNSVNGNLSTEAQVNQIYLNLFNREGDAAGLIYWASQIDSGNLELASIANDLTWAALNNAGSEVDKQTLTHKTNAGVQYTYEIRKSTASILAYQAKSTSPWITGNNLNEAKTFINEIGYSKVATLSDIQSSIAKFSSTPNSFKIISSDSINNSIDNITGLSLDNLSNDFLEDLRYPEIAFYNNSSLLDRQIESNKLNYVEISDQLSNEEYISNLYEHVLDRTYDIEGLNYWVSNLNSGLETRYEALLGFAESAENTTLFTEMKDFG